MDMNEAVAKAISAERTIAGLTVRQLAEKSGIPERSLMRVLQAERDIKVNQIDLIAEVLKLYPHEILEHAELILERATRAKPDTSNVIVGGFGKNTDSNDEVVIPENVEEVWGIAGDPKGDDPIDHSQN